ncbi:DUF6090 family protein [Mangrovimonas sp. DI 80]|uniref:DUF6090 family protein n=1 Tax=Mangrovimonas sp. DI 80 TaxID=1779330 RepID=UPI000975C867|nr:DUF6090 family protein [Mangrovimonas sp. DI 80]OMP32347.1 hypothetical protein BKM32_04660 [Mangrovimonas sp. DI 80]
MASNKLSKYLMYAIGEIVLVVIGILIALQVNNVNERHKERQTERLILQEIRDNLNYDLEDMESNIGHLENKITSCRLLLKALQHKTPYQDSLGYFFYYLKVNPHVSHKTSGYNLLTSKGVDIIQNDALRKGITNLYEEGYEYLTSFERERVGYNAFLEPRIVPYYSASALQSTKVPKAFKGQATVERMANIGFFKTIRNYEAMQEDMELQGILKDIETWEVFGILKHKKLKEDTQELIAQIDDYLQKH